MAARRVSRTAVAVLVAEGLPSKEIAARLGCSLHTVAGIRSEQRRAREASAAAVAREFIPLDGIPAADADRVLRNLRATGNGDLAAMLGLAPAEVAA